MGWIVLNARTPHDLEATPLVNDHVWLGALEVYLTAFCVRPRANPRQQRFTDATTAVIGTTAKDGHIVAPRSHLLPGVHVDLLDGRERHEHIETVSLPVDHGRGGSAARNAIRELRLGRVRHVEGFVGSWREANASTGHLSVCGVALEQDAVPKGDVSQAEELVLEQLVHPTVGRPACH